jgi:hypothetical protein
VLRCFQRQLCPIQASRTSRRSVLCSPLLSLLGAEVLVVVALSPRLVRQGPFAEPGEFGNRFFYSLQTVRVTDERRGISCVGELRRMGERHVGALEEQRTWGLEDDTTTATYQKG